METIIDADGAYVGVVRGWLSKSRKIYTQFVESLDWCQPDVMVWNNVYKTPRLQYACGDSSAAAYKYSGSNIPMTSWDGDVKDYLDIMRNIRDGIVTDEDVSYRTDGYVPNSCLVNYYRTGQEYVSYHSDKEVQDPKQSVVTVSLGTSRVFKLQRKRDKKVIDVILNSGDMLLMCGACQSLWKHSIPKVALSRCNEGRISLTYRLN